MKKRIKTIKPWETDAWKEGLPNPGSMMDTQVLERNLVAYVTYRAKQVARNRKNREFSVSFPTSVRRLGLKRRELRDFAEDYLGFRFLKEDKHKPFNTLEDFMRILVRYRIR